MQADRFTVKSQEALAAAQRLAGARRNPEVTRTTSLAALLEQEGGIVVPVLRRANADLERRRRANEARRATHRERRRQRRAADRLGGDRAPEPRRRRGAGHGRRYVSTEHILLALAADPKIDAGRDQLFEAVQQVRGPHRVTDQNPEDKYQALGASAATSPRPPSRASSTR